MLGTTNDVFFYVAPFRYPKSNCGLLFSQTSEEAHKESGNATPFDSGGLRRTFTRSNPAESVNDFLARHELPTPEHRQYLGQGMTALFNQPLEYVNGTSPCHPNPVGLTGGDQRRWTHEVRIPRSGRVQGSPHLQAVFAPWRVVSDPQVEALPSWCERESVDRILFDTPKRDDFKGLQRECLNYIERELYYKLWQTLCGSKI